MNKVLNRYEDFGKIINTLIDRGMEDDSYYVQYVLSPYMQALGYDVFDIDETERMFHGDTYKVLGIEPESVGEQPIHFIFSLGDYREELKEEDNIRAYVLFDKGTKSITLYYYVLEEWYSIHESRFLMDEEEDIKEERNNLVSLNKVITKEEFQTSYLTLGERLFTGSVVDTLLANGELENRFIRQALVDELLKPDTHMIKMLANKLTDYSTQEISWIEGMLDGLKTSGLVSLLETAISNEELEIIIRPKSQPLPSATQKRVKKQEEVQTNISHKADRLKEAGFSTSGLGQGATREESKKEEPKKEEPKKEEPKKEEDTFDIGGLKDQLTSSVAPKEAEDTYTEDDEEELSDTGLQDISSFFDE